MLRGVLAGSGMPSVVAGAGREDGIHICYSLADIASFINLLFFEEVATLLVANGESAHFHHMQHFFP